VVTILSATGVPTPVVQTKLRAPSSRMGPADDVDAAAKSSPLYAKYGTRVDSQSARELLAARLQAATPVAAAAAAPAEPKPAESHAAAAGALAGGRPHSAASSTRDRESSCRRKSCGASSGSSRRASEAPPGRFRDYRQMPVSGGAERARPSGGSPSAASIVWRRP
jgi:hypothetical protein